MHSLGTAVPRTLSLKPRGRVSSRGRHSCSQKCLRLPARRRSVLGRLPGRPASGRGGLPPRPSSAPPAPGAPPPRARRQGEPREGRTAAGRERGARATGPRAGPAYSAAGAGARDGAAAAPSSPRPSAEGLVAGGGRLAGEDPGRGGLADWGPRAIKSSLLPRVWQSVPEPRHRGCVCFWTDTRTTRSTLVFSKAAPGSDVGTLWPPWAAVTLGVCLTVVGTACCLPYRDGAAIS